MAIGNHRKCILLVHDKIRGQGQPLKISIVDSRESPFLMKSTAHIKGAYRVKFVIIYFAETIVSQNKNFFFGNLNQIIFKYMVLLIFTKV